jgi:hypothetical protein
MTDAAIPAISGTRRQARELVDGTIEVKIHIDPRFKAEFHAMFPEIDMPVAIAPLQPDFETETAKTKPPAAQTEKAQKEDKPFGAKASLLHKGGFFLNPHVLKCIGSDAQFLEWVRHQPCAVTQEFDRNTDEATGETRERCDAAHYRSIEGGAGTGIKPPYSAIPLVHHWHDRQTREGHSVFADQLRDLPEGMNDETAGRLWMERRRNHYVSLWASSMLARKFNKKSMGFVDPHDVLGWADVYDIVKWLPPGYR